MIFQIWSEEKLRALHRKFPLWSGVFSESFVRDLLNGGEGCLAFVSASEPSEVLFDCLKNEAVRIVFCESIPGDENVNLDWEKLEALGRKVLFLPPALPMGSISNEVAKNQKPLVLLSAKGSLSNQQRQPPLSLLLNHSDLFPDTDRLIAEDLDFGELVDTIRSRKTVISADLNPHWNFWLLLLGAHLKTEVVLHFETGISARLLRSGLVQCFPNVEVARQDVKLREILSSLICQRKTKGCCHWFDAVKLENAVVDLQPVVLREKILNFLSPATPLDSHNQKVPMEMGCLSSKHPLLVTWKNFVMDLQVDAQMKLGHFLVPIPHSLMLEQCRDAELTGGAFTWDFQIWRPFFRFFLGLKQALRQSWVDHFLELFSVLGHDVIPICEEILPDAESPQLKSTILCADWKKQLALSVFQTQWTHLGTKKDSDLVRRANLAGQLMADYLLRRSPTPHELYVSTLFNSIGGRGDLALKRFKQYQTASYEFESVAGLLAYKFFLWGEETLADAYRTVLREDHLFESCHLFGAAACLPGLLLGDDTNRAIGFASLLEKHSHKFHGKLRTMLLGNLAVACAITSRISSSDDLLDKIRTLDEVFYKSFENERSMILSRMNQEVLSEKEALYETCLEPCIRLMQENGSAK